MMEIIKSFEKWLVERVNLDRVEKYADDILDPVDGEWEIEDVIAVSDEEPDDLDESIVIGAEFGNAKVSRGKKIYITARISKREGEPVNRNQIGVIETRVVNIFQSLRILNKIKKA